MNRQEMTGEALFRVWLHESVSETDHVLDLGCGEGLFTLSLAASARAVTGVDLSGKSIRTAQARLRQSGVANVTFVHAAGQDLTFPEHSVDVMTSRNGPLGLEGFLEEARRVVKPGGVLLEVTVGEADAREVTKLLQTADVDPEPGKKARLRERIAAHGFRLERMEDVITSIPCERPEEVVRELVITRTVGAARARAWTETLREKWAALADGSLPLTHHRIVWLAVNEK